MIGQASSFGLSASFAVTNAGKVGIHETS